jgi:hypothetical protein
MFGIAVHGLGIGGKQHHSGVDQEIRLRRLSRLQSLARHLF